MIGLQNLGPFPVCFTGTDESLRISVPRWGDLVSCFCPKTAYLKQLLVKVWEGETLLSGAKNMFQSVLSSGSEAKYTRVGYLHIWTPAEKRGLCTCKPAWSCYFLLDPMREQESWQKRRQWDGGSFSCIAGLPIVSEPLSFRRKMKEKHFRVFQKLKESNTSQPNELLDSGPCSGFPFCDLELGPAMDSPSKT